MSITCIINF